MPSPFQGISTMSSALQAFQRQMDVLGNNVSNVDTPGYSRQRVNLVEADPTQVSQGTMISLGNGVSISSVTRIRDMFLEGRSRTTASDQGKTDVQSGQLSQIESLMNEPGTNGIADALDKFWNSWSSLASNPADAGSKSAVQAAGNTLASRVSGTYASLQNQKTQITGQINDTVRAIQSDMDEIAKLNDQIRQTQTLGAEPNNLLDRRDQLVQDLASKVDINVQKFGDGSYAIYAGQITLVDPGGSHTFPTSWNAATSSISNATTTSTVISGQLAGLFDSYNKVTGYQAQLDTLANSLRTQVNSITMTGTNAAGATGLKFFNDVTTGPQTGAVDFALDKVGVVGPPASVGVGTSASAIPSGTSGKAGDGSIALALSQLRDAPVAALGNVSATSFYATLVGTIGRDSATAAAAQKTQTAIGAQVTQQIQSLSGVSIDDEMANMLRFQRSYQAAAKALSTMNSVLDDLMAMMR